MGNALPEVTELLNVRAGFTQHLERALLVVTLPRQDLRKPPRAPRVPCTTVSTPTIQTAFLPNASDTSCEQLQLELISLFLPGRDGGTAPPALVDLLPFLSTGHLGLTPLALRNPNLIDSKPQHAEWSRFASDHKP